MSPAKGFSEIGTSGLNRFAGVVTEEEFIPGLTGRQATKTFKEMRENDPIVGAFLFVIDNLIRGVEWYMEPFEDTPADIEAADFVDGCRDDMSSSWNDTISEAMSMLEYGWAFHEVVYKRRQGLSLDPSQNSKYNDNRIGWRKIPLRAQETLYRWEMDDEGGIQGMIQKAPPDYKDRIIPITQALLFRTTTRKNNPEGRSLLRNAYRPWYFKKRIEEIEGVGIERDLAGLPRAYVDPEILSPNATPAQKLILEGIKDIVTKVRRDALEGVIFPRQYDDDGNLLYEFDLISAAGARQFDTNAVIERKSREIAMTVAADFILLGHEGVGSYALSSDKTDMFTTACNTFLDIVGTVFQRFAIPRLLELNGMDQTRVPNLKHGDLAKPDLSVMAQFITALVGAGVPVLSDPKSEAWARKLADMPELSEEEMAAAQPPAPPAAPGGPGSPAEAKPVPTPPVPAPVA